MAWTQIKGFIPNVDADDKPVVIETSINSKDCFDLFKTENILLLKRVMSEAERKGLFPPDLGQKSPVLRDHNNVRKRIPNGSKVASELYEFPNIFDERLILLALSFIAKRQGKNSYKAVRFPFWEGKQFRKGSYFFEHTNVQVCIFDKRAFDEYILLDPMKQRPSSASAFLNFEDMGLVSQPKVLESENVERMLNRVEIPV